MGFMMKRVGINAARLLSVALLLCLPIGTECAAAADADATGGTPPLAVFLGQQALRDPQESPRSGATSLKKENISGKSVKISIRIWDDRKHKY